jgi:hypothetical protein
MGDSNSVSLLFIRRVQALMTLRHYPNLYYSPLRSDNLVLRLLVRRGAQRDHRIYFRVPDHD